MENIGHAVAYRDDRYQLRLQRRRRCCRRRVDDAAGSGGGRATTTYAENIGGRGGHQGATGPPLTAAGIGAILPRPRPRSARPLPRSRLGTLAALPPRCTASPASLGIQASVPSISPPINQFTAAIALIYRHSRPLVNDRRPPVLAASPSAPSPRSRSTTDESSSSVSRRHRRTPESPAKSEPVL